MTQHPTSTYRRHVASPAGAIARHRTPAAHLLTQPQLDELQAVVTEGGDAPQLDQQLFGAWTQVCSPR